MTSEQAGRAAYVTALLGVMFWGHNLLAFLTDQPIPILGWVLTIYATIMFIIMLTIALCRRTTE